MGGEKMICRWERMKTDPLQATFNQTIKRWMRKPKSKKLRKRFMDNVEDMEERSGSLAVHFAIMFDERTENRKVEVASFFLKNANKSEETLVSAGMVVIIEAASDGLAERLKLLRN